MDGPSLYRSKPLLRVWSWVNLEGPDEAGCACGGLPPPGDAGNLAA